MVALAMALLPVPAGAKKGPGFLTSADPYLTLTGPGSVKAIITVGDEVGDFFFEGIPDGIGATDGPGRNTVDVYVAHEQSTVAFPPLPFGFGPGAPPQQDFQDASVSKLTLDGDTGAVLHAEVAIPASAGFLRFCSAFMADKEHGFSKPTFFANEESNDIIDVPAGAVYGPDPGLGGQRQAGYVVALDTRNGQFRAIQGMGRHNHENTIVVPGGWKKTMAVLSTDDTFSGPSAQLYLYLAKNDREVWRDQGDLWAFRVTHDNGTPVDPGDAFNEANDYLDLAPGDEFRGEFIRVPDDVADGTTGIAPQDALEDWSNDNNVFQFIRLEDIATDKHNPRVVYIADTGRSRVVPDAATGRLVRGPSGTDGMADNGAMFKMVFNEDDPRIVDSLTVLAQGDDDEKGAFIPFRAPDNIDTSANSLMVQEDADDAQIWRYDLSSGVWSVVATVNDPDGESSGILDVSKWFGAGYWLLDVQAHGFRQAEEAVPNPVDPEGPDLIIKREDGQLLLMHIPGS